MVPKIVLIPAGLALGFLAACTSIPTDWGRADANRMAVANGLDIPQTDDAAGFTRKALASPLSAETAVQLALLNNPQLREESARLGFAAADLYDAGRLANPTFSLTRLSPGNTGLPTAQLTMEVAFNFLNLLFLPANTRFAESQLEAAKLQMASSTLDLASDVEAAWYAAAGAEQLLQMREASARAQQASATLAQRYFDAGNISPRELAMEQAAASAATLAALSARAKSADAHSALNRLMGLSAEQERWTLDARLPLPPDTQIPLKDLQQLALKSRVDVMALQKNAQAIADRYHLVRATRLIAGLQIGVIRERDYDRAINIGPTLSLELPLFNWGGGRTAAAQAALQQAEATLDAQVLDMSNGVKLAADQLQTYAAMASEYRNTLIPSREAAVARAQEEQNYMLIGVFEVIAAKQQEYDAYAGYIEAVRDYWMAHAALARAVGRSLPDAEKSAGSPLDSKTLLEPRAAASGHANHQMPGMEMKDMEMDDDMEGMDHDGSTNDAHQH